MIKDIREIVRSKYSNVNVNGQDDSRWLCYLIDKDYVIISIYTKVFTTMDKTK